MSQSSNKHSPLGKGRNKVFRRIMSFRPVERARIVSQREDWNCLDYIEEAAHSPNNYAPLNTLVILCCWIDGEMTLLNDDAILVSGWVSH